MIMGIFDFLGGLVKPVTELIGDMHTSAEEKGKIVNEMQRLQNEIASKMLDYEAKVMDLQTSVIKSEAQGASWMQRNWRPITMLTFLALVVADSFGWLANRLAPEAWTLLQLGLGGYVLGRSVEKVMPSVKGMFGK